MKCKRGKSASEIVKTLCRPPTLLDPQRNNRHAFPRQGRGTYYYYMRRIHKTKAISIEASHKICSKGNDTPSTKVQYLYDSRVLQKTKTPPTYTSYSPYKKKTHNSHTPHTQYTQRQYIFLRIDLELKKVLQLLLLLLHKTI